MFNTWILVMLTMVAKAPARLFSWLGSSSYVSRIVCGRVAQLIVSYYLCKETDNTNDETLLHSQLIFKSPFAS